MFGAREFFSKEIHTCIEWIKSDRQVIKLSIHRFTQKYDYTFLSKNILLTPNF